MLTLFIIPLRIIYSKRGGLSANTNPLYISMGNFGSAKHECLSIFMMANHDMFLHCNKGQIGELTYFGVIPDTKLDFQADFCGDP